MSFLPKQPESLLREFAGSEIILPHQLMTNPFFFEWVFCSDLANKECPNHLKNKSPILSEIFHRVRTQLAEFSRECRILRYAITQYRLLKGEFTSIEKGSNEPVKIIESCFQVADAYWRVIKNYLDGNSFKKSEHELFFFKVIKPSFISECDFLSLAYHALLFSKATDKDLVFWEREKNRKEKLIHDNQDFFSLYLNGNTENDEVWFTRTMQVDYTSHDHLVSSWFAINRYEAFIETAILQSNKQII